MRKNIASVIDAFHNEEKYQDKTCRTDGRVIYSYAMPIAVRHGGTVYVLDESESPSATTTSQIRAVRAAFPSSATAGDADMLRDLRDGFYDDDGSQDVCGPSRGGREDFHADG